MSGVFSFDGDESTVFVARETPTPAPTLCFVVTVEAGADRGRTLTLDGSEPLESLVGQSPACALRLSDPTASRRHAALDVVGDRLRVRDLGSKNGTYVGSLRVIEAFAAAGDALTVGATVLRVASAAAKPDALPLTDRFGEALGVSREMRRLFPLLARLSAATLPVLIEGETGTGKEAVARSIHDQGPRAKMPFVVFDCTAVSASLVESELFGHERGAFTGAVGRRKGVFEQAHHGTLFIDELGDLPLDLQAKLLRVLETGQVRRVGGDQWLSCDVRVVAATRRDMDRLVSGGQFRDDLFHRLAVGRVALPPLRQRRGDLPILIEHFCGLLGVSPTVIPRATLDAWTRESWPGNVRELRNAVTRQVTLGDLAAPSTTEGAETPVLSGSAFERILSSLLPYDEARQAVLALFQREYTDRMVAANKGSVQRAAESSGLALRYFQLLRARQRGAGER